MTTSLTIPRFASTNDPAVVAIIEGEDQRQEEFREAIAAFAEKAGATDPGACLSRSFGAVHVVGMGGETAPTVGRWKHSGRGGWVPWTNNPLEAEFSALRYVRLPVPGVPAMIWEPRGPMRAYSLPAYVTLDGVAYYGFEAWGANATGDGFTPGEGGWQEIRASAFHLAQESRQTAGAAA